MAQIKVLSWNIFWGLGAPKHKFEQALLGINYFFNRRDRKIIKKICWNIRTLGPDILALQEIDAGSLRNGNFNQIKLNIYQITLI